MDAAYSQKQEDLTVKKKIFLQHLEKTGKIVIIFDGFDEISPNHNPKFNILVRAIRGKTGSYIWVLSVFYLRKLEDILIKLSFTLQHFNIES